MLIDKNLFEEWMKRIMLRFDSLEKQMGNTPITPETVKKERKRYNGELLLDNQDLCMMLNVSKRSLQRYRKHKGLVSKRIEQKTYYLESDVEKFINEHLKPKNKG
jgi:hypothetical protein